MTTEELKKALSQQSREIVNVNVGQVPLQPTVTRGGQYNVVTAPTPKQNSLTRLATALNQLPQIAGQFKNIRQKAGIEKVQAMDPQDIKDELTRRAEAGDQESKNFLFDWGHQEAVDKELYNQLFKSEIRPALDRLEQDFQNSSLQDINKQLTKDGKIDTDENIQQRLVEAYKSAIPEEINEMVENFPNQVSLHNQLLLQLPAFASRTHAQLVDKRQKFLNDSMYQEIGSSLSGLRDAPTAQVTPPGDNVEITGGLGMLPPLTGDPFRDRSEESEPDLSPQTVQSNISIYSPQKAGKLKKMEGGYASSRPGANGKSIVRTLEDFRKDPENTVVTVAGNPEFYGRRYVVERMTYQKSDGTRHTLNNVPVMVHDTGEDFKTAPEGMFDIPVERDTDEDAMRANDALLKGISFIRDQDKETEKPEQVTKTAGQVVKQSSNDYQHKLKSRAEQMSVLINNTQNNALRDAGTNVDQSKIKNQVIADTTRELLLSVSDGNLEEVGEFVDLAKKGLITIGGIPYDAALLTSVTKAIDSKQEDLDRQEDLDKDKIGEDEAEELLKNIAGLRGSSDTMGPGEYKKSLDDLEKQTSQLRSRGELGQAAYNNVISEINRSREGDLKTSDEWAKPGFRTSIHNAFHADAGEIYLGRKFMDVAESLGNSMEPFIKADAFNITNPNSREILKDIVQGADRIAFDSARTATLNQIVPQFEERGLTEAINFQVPVAGDLEGPPEPIRDLYRRLFEENYKTSVQSVYSRLKGSLEARAANQAQALETSVSTSLEEGEPIEGVSEEASKQMRYDDAAKAVEERLGGTDLLDEKGTLQVRNRELPTYYLRKLVKTFAPEDDLEQNSERMQVIVERNTLEQRQAAFRMANRKIEENDFGFLKYNAKKLTEKLRSGDTSGYSKSFKEFTNIFKYTGLSMKIHGNQGIFEDPILDPKTGRKKGDLGLLDNVKPKREAERLNLNWNDRYKKEETAKTHVYNLEAIISWEKGTGTYAKTNMEILYNTYFKDNDAVSLEQFANYQLELGRKLKFIPELTEDN